MTKHLNTLQKHRSITLERFDKFLQKGQFSDVNLQSLLWLHRDQDAVKLSAYKVPDLMRIPFEEAVKGEFKPAKVGDVFGPSWATVWFKVEIQVPGEWKNHGVTLLFDPSCEALIFSQTGEPLQGITGSQGHDRRVDFALGKLTGSLVLYIEVACNGMFGNGDYLIGPPDPNRDFSLKTAELAVPNIEAHQLLHDFEIISSLAKELPADSQGAADALYCANKIINTIQPDPTSIAEARLVAYEFFEKRKQFGYVEHSITATGHCHIDTAWLWPYDETKRKIARSWATQCTLIDKYPKYTFSCSQAQQFDWVEQYYPKLFKNILSKVSTGNFIPVGGTWVEMDCNIPSGEALCRQFLYGQRYFEKTFRRRCSVFWLPDTFGYAAQLPQIIKQSDMRYFFTQKLSWNNINKFPHTTFMWTGLDGSSVLTHFSPADTYCAQNTVKEVVFSVKNHKDKEYSNQSLLLFGHGDGGGGPTKEMIERMRRMKSLSSLPATVNSGNPNVFFEELEKNSRDLVTWRGELYFELHRGTYTSQALTKKYNRVCEYLMRTVELLAVISKVSKGSKYPKDEIDDLWKSVLLNQFHDVLPGSSIQIVYEDSRKIYEDVINKANKLIASAFESISVPDSEYITLFNPTSWKIEDHMVYLSKANNENRYAVVEIPPFSFKTVKKSEAVNIQAPISVSGMSGKFVVENKFWICTFDQHGRITSLFDKEYKRDLIPKGEFCNNFKIFEDIPLFWDAWDVEVYHLEKGWDAGLGNITVIENGPMVVKMKVTHPISSTSTLEQIITLSSVDRAIQFDTTVSWNENRKILKVEFPVNISCANATYETQFGIISRPTHYNTSWDLARFEVCGHKFVDFSETGYGVSIFNDCKYGHAVHDNVMRMTLLRSPKAPDGMCDIGEHTFKYALYPHPGGFTEEIVKRAYQFNVPVQMIPRKIEINKPIFEIDQANVVIDTIKLKEDANGNEVVVRLYESVGARGCFVLKSMFPIKKANRCNIMEDLGEELEVVDNSIKIQYKPFEIVSICIVL